MSWQRERERNLLSNVTLLFSGKNTREKALRIDRAVRERLRTKHTKKTNPESETLTQNIFWDIRNDSLNTQDVLVKEKRRFGHWPSGVEVSLRRAELEGFSRLLGLGCRSGDFTMADMRICWRAAGMDGAACSWALKWAADREREIEIISYTIRFPKTSGKDCCLYCVYNWITRTKVSHLLLEENAAQFSSSAGLPPALSIELFLSPALISCQCTVKVRRTDTRRLWLR